MVQFSHTGLGTLWDIWATRKMADRQILLRMLLPQFYAYKQGIHANKHFKYVNAIIYWKRFQNKHFFSFETHFCKYMDILDE